MIERKIVIGLITSTDYCTKVRPIWDSTLLESAAARRLAEWCWEHFSQFNKAPGREIETIYYAKLKDGRLPKDVAEELEQDILPGLSEEYDREDFPLEFLTQETEKYLTERHLTMHLDAVQTLLARGQVEEAKKMVETYRPLSGATDKFEEHIRTVHEIRRLERPRPTLYLRPWLRAGQLTIIYGNYGSGKSLLVISLAYMLGLRTFDGEDVEIGEWTVRTPTGCLYIDGELGELEMEERVAQFEWLGRQSSEHRMRVLSVPEYQTETQDTFYLSKRENQRKIIQWLRENTEYKLIVLDSASTLFGLEDENNNSEWNNKVNPFLRELRALDVACILLHHSGKDGKKGLRGASAMGAMAHNIYKLTNHPSKTDGEAWFVLTKDKQRAAGFQFRSFGVHYSQNEDQTETHWEITRTN